MEKLWKNHFYLPILKPSVLAQTTQEQTDTIPENVSTLLSKHGLHSSNQSEYSQPLDASSARKRRTPTTLRM
jgi:hypothetical protein